VHPPSLLHRRQATLLPNDLELPPRLCQPWETPLFRTYVDPFRGHVSMEVGLCCAPFPFSVGGWRTYLYQLFLKDTQTSALPVSYNDLSRLLSVRSKIIFM
jgi:hypothetical protein